MDLRSADIDTIVRTGNKVSKDAYDRYLKVGAPMMIEHYLSQGDVQKATEFKEFVEAESTKKAMTHWTRAQFAAAIGDDSGFNGNIAAAHNAKGYYDDTSADPS